VDEGDLDLPGREHAEQLVVVARLGDRDLEVLSLAREPLDDPGKERRGTAAEHADPERTEIPRDERLEIRLRGREAGADRARMLPDDLPGRGEPYRLRPAGALDQLLADDALERRDLLADRRLGVAELRRSTIERRFRCDRVEGQKVSKLDTDPSGRAENTASIRAELPPTRAARLRRLIGL
jgi:hypothetical protein